jgi:hypothetical protein
MTADIDSSDFPVDVDTLKAEVPAMMEQALPPDWLQAQAERLISAAVPYALGDTDSFTVTIPLKDRVEAFAAVLKDTLHDEVIFTDLYEGGIDFALEQYAEMQVDLPSFLAMNDEEAAAILRRVLPADWVLAQIDKNIDEIVPYLTGEEDSFLLRLDILDRMDALEAEVTALLMKPEAYDFILNDLIAPYLRENTADIMTLPVGVVFTDDEIINVVEEVLPPDWYRARVSDIIGQVFAYFEGSAATINIVVPLVEIKPAAIDALTDMADTKLEVLVNALPVGTPEQVADLLADPPVGVLPSFRPPDMSYRDFMELLSIDVSSLTDTAVTTFLPDRIVISDTDIRESLTEDGDEDILAQARDMVQEGLTFTDADLREEMGADYDTIEDVRDWIASDFTFTDADLRDYLNKESGGDDVLRTIDDVRPIVDKARTWLWAVWLVPALLLVGIGFLGGRRWESRVVWGASVLAIAALITYIAFGPVFSALAEPRIDEAINSNIDETDGIGALAAEKGAEIARDTVDSFIGGINIQAIVLFAVSLVVIGVIVFWHPWRRRPEMVSGQITSGDLPPPNSSPPDLRPHNILPRSQPSGSPDDLLPADQPPGSSDRSTG